MTISSLKIKNFKSIKNMDIDCKKINVFIGEPNTGKSNILEAIGLLSCCNYLGDIREFVRFESLIDLFYDRNIGDEISISFDDKNFSFFFKNGLFIGDLSYNVDPVLGNSAKVRRFRIFGLNYEGDVNQHYMLETEFLPKFKYYKFKKIDAFTEKNTDFLIPPSGSNLMHIILTNKELKNVISNLYKKYGYRIVFKPTEGKIEVQKEQEDIITSIPYILSSETLQRITFYLAAIYSNKEAVISFEEPEAHAFPYYMKYLAERITMDETNQYFIVTHNPYFLMSLIEKAPKKDLAAFVTYFEDYQTKIKPLTPEYIEDAFSMGPDVFLNLDTFIEGKQ